MWFFYSLGGIALLFLATLAFCLFRRKQKRLVYADSDWRSEVGFWGQQ